MNRRDIQELRVHVGYPAITLIMKCDKTKIKEKFLDVVNHLSSDEPIVAVLLGEFDALFDNFACPVNGKSIALFVSKYGARFYALSFEMDEVATCGQTFKLDTLVARLNRLKRYWMIDCSLPEIKLFEGVDDFFIEVEKSRVALSIPGEPSVHPFEQDPENFDKYLGDYLEQDVLPICLVGSFKETEELLLHSLIRHRVTITAPTIHDIPGVMSEYFAKEMNNALEELESAVEGAEFVTSLQDILYAARQGQVAQLLVEQDYHFDACEEQVTRQVLTQKPVCPVGYQKISLVDQIIESVRSKGGAIIIVPNGTLKKYDRLAALLRFF